MVRVSSFDEFTKLETVILGTFDNKILPLESQDPNANLSEGLKFLKRLIHNGTLMK